MKQKNIVQPHPGGCIIEVDASPGAKVTEITGVNEWRGSLQVKVAAQAHAGAANEELMRHLAERLKIEKSDITILKGERSHRKILFLPMDAEKVRALLAVN